MIFPPTNRRNGNRVAVACALASQTIWLPLIFIDLNDHSSRDVVEVRNQPLASASHLLTAPTDQPYTNSISANQITESQRTAENHSGFLLNTTKEKSLPPSSGSSAASNDSPSLLATASLGSSRTGFTYQKNNNPTLISILSSYNPSHSPSRGVPHGLIGRNYTKADLLGGVLILRDLNEADMPPIAQAERASWKRSGDPLSPLPKTWRESMRGALNGLDPFMSHGSQKGIGGETKSLAIDMARMVHVPSSRIQKSAQVPLALQSDGTVDILTQPDDPAILEEIRTWSSKQILPSKGRMVPAVVHLHPMPTSDQQFAGPTAQNRNDSRPGTSAETTISPMPPIERSKAAPEPKASAPAASASVSSPEPTPTVQRYDTSAEHVSQVDSIAPPVESSDSSSAPAPTANEIQP